MAYSIRKSDGTLVTVADNAIDSDFYNPTGGSTGLGQGIQLIGRNAIDYGAAIAQTFLQLTENFSSSTGTQPIGAKALQGQLWYDQSLSKLYVRVTPGVPLADSLSPNWEQIVTSGSGNATTASQLQTARNISATGDAAWTVSFDGSTNVTSGLVLSSVNGDIGSFGDSTHVPVFTVNAKGLITGVTNTLVTSSGNAPGLTGGAAGGLPYQSAPSTTTFLTATATGRVLVSGTTPSWSTTPTFVGTNITGTAAALNIGGNAAGLSATLVATSGGTAQTTYATGDTLYASAANTLSKLAVGTAGQVLTVAGGVPTWAAAGGGGAGTVTSVSVVSANGLAGSVATATTTPAITLTTSITGILKGNGTAISAATSGTDYSLGTSALATGIVKSTTTTGALTIAIAGDFPTLNQNTSGTAAGLSATLATGSGGTGLSSVGTAGQVLTIVGGVPAWATSLTSGGFTYNPATGAFLVNNTLSVAAPAAVTIKGAAVNTGVSADGGYVNIVGGYSDEASSFGGDVNITGGQGSYGGFVIITGGESIGADAGEVHITGGYGATGNDPGGDVIITGGDSLGGVGGDVIIKPGTGFIQDGVVDIQSTGGVSTNGNLSITTAGKGLRVKDGTNATFGTGAVLVGGTLVVSTTSAITASAIFLQVSTTGGTQGHLSYTISNATSFTVTSTSGTDTSTFNWIIINPA